MFEDLYEGDDQQNDLMIKMSPYFFCDLNDILLNYFNVQVYKLTDRALSGDRKNLTFLRIESDLKEYGLLANAEDQEVITTCREVIQAFRDDVAKDARNRVCAHLDLETVRMLDDRPEEPGIGAHDVQDRVRFFEHLYRFIAVADRLLGVDVGEIRNVGRLPGSSPKEMFQWIKERINMPRR
ncbi:hypothetical protein Q6A49_01395 [Pseudomonas sp. 22-AL-CL-001]|uniref:AbiU2 domain-containing protein n=1 Tax=Pseudomonas alabamensis TaxID=3064349 RepID=UPI0027124CB3|nr:hypothetical protein [Pseudomonas sp. 22-AL-CL-001]MDO7909188.1 hypothetical protein [Pseudomonas sp. 22-AL-CL-001]